MSSWASSRTSSRRQSPRLPATSRSFSAATSPETEDLLADAQLEADRLAGVIDNLLVIARGEGSTDTEPVLLDAVIARALSWLARADPRVMVAVSGDKRLVVEANEAQLTMVLRNLLSNAAKYGGPGQIDLTVRLCGPMATVTVADRGPGIAPEDLEHVFEPFYRAEASSHLVSGLGVGLAVCRRVVEAMGGRCTAGTREGGGAAFSFEVPVAAVGDELEFGVLDGPRALIGADLSA
ncbi:MAG: HAMP domain-containing sensor histidine kinase [Chloroflexota bacterium]